MSGLLPRTVEFYHEKLAKLPQGSCVLQLKKKTLKGCCTYELWL
ncbi:uncharacterized protein METZ01_LOCUS481369, partial [marine metagenome]